VLVCVSGLPATGKSTVSQRLVALNSWPYVRVDTIETAIARAEGQFEASNRWLLPPGYLVAYEVAAEQLRHGLSVVAEAVNPTATARAGWRDAADRGGARLLHVEVICSDLAEHRRRAEERKVDVAGLKLPSWQDIISRHYEDWTSERMLIDTAKTTAEEAVQLIAVAAAV
jgi:predicted kinase